MSFKNEINNILNLKKGEGKIVVFPIIYTFFIGASLAFFVTSSTSLFLNNFDREMLSVSFIVAGIIVLIVGRLYSMMQKRVIFSKNLLIGFLFLIVSIVGLLILFYLSKSIFIIFILYAWIRVFTYLQAVTFWSLAGSLFTLQQGKRLFGLLTFGEVFASILAFFSVPFLLKIIQTEDLLILSSIAMLISFIFLVVIVSKNKEKLSVTKSSKDITVKSDAESQQSAFEVKRYYRLFFLIAFIPIFAQFFVDFIFQAQAKVEFPEKESLTAFVGLFFGVSSIVEFILKAFVSGRLLNKYGVRLGLLAFPVVLLISFFFASSIGILYGAVTLFFSFVTMGRLFSRAVRTSFSDPATQILYQPLPPEERVAFQNKIESGPKAFASIAAGVLLYLFAKIDGFSLVYFSAFLLVVIIVWIKVSNDIFAEYKIIIQKVLSNKSKKIEFNPVVEIIGIIRAKLLRTSGIVHQKIFYYAKKVFPFTEDQFLVTEEDKILSNEIKPKLTKIVQLSQSEDSKDRALAADLFYLHPIYKIEKIAIRLMNDSVYQVRYNAIVSAGKLKEEELFAYIFSNFKQPAYSNISYSTMINIGEKIFPELSSLFFKLEYEPDLQLKIIDIFEKIGGLKAIAFLRQKINYPNKSISDRVVSALAFLEYTVDNFESPFISDRLELEIKYYTYVAACLDDLVEFDDNIEVIQSLIAEMSEKRKKIFMLLSVIYDPFAIRLIRENIETDNSNLEFALEIADTVISEIHKEILQPVFEYLTNAEIVLRYQLLFPQEKLSVKDRLSDMINSDVNVIGVYTKASALSLLEKFDLIEIYQIIKANIVHPKRIIRETAAMLLYQKDKQLFQNTIFEFRSKIKDFNRIINKIQLVGTDKMLLIERLRIIKSMKIFRSVEHDKLIDFVDNSYEMVLEQGQDLTVDAHTKSEVYILVSGSLKQGVSEQNFEPGSVISIFNNINNSENLILKATEQSFLIKSEIRFINSIFTGNPDFADDFLEHI